MRTTREGGPLWHRLAHGALRVLRRIPRDAVRCDRREPPQARGVALLHIVRLRSLHLRGADHPLRRRRNAAEPSEREGHRRNARLHRVTHQVGTPFKGRRRDPHRTPSRRLLPRERLRQRDRASRERRPPQPLARMVQGHRRQASRTQGHGGQELARGHEADARLHRLHALRRAEGLRGLRPLHRHPLLTRMGDRPQLPPLRRILQEFQRFRQGRRIPRPRSRLLQDGPRKGRRRRTLPQDPREGDEGQRLPR